MVATMSELVSLKFIKPSEDLTKHIDRMTFSVEELASMKAKLEDMLAVDILIASVLVPALQPVRTAIKTLTEFELI